MSSDPQEALDRAAELADAHRALRERRAEVAEHAAAVHDDAARVHEELGGDALLTPEQLRAHADAEREVAEQERAALDDGTS